MSFKFHLSQRNNSTGRGFTLIELLIVMVILTLVTVATIPLMQPPSADRKLREAAREVGTTFELARARALETGRPAGVWIEPQSATSKESIKLYICDVPPPYAGDTTSSTATLRTNGQVTLSNSGSVGQLCKAGDTIRFNSRGPFYLIGGTAGTAISTTFNVTAPLGYSLPLVDLTNVSFQIYRQPLKSSVAPTILPTNAPAAVVDLQFSGYGSSGAEFNSVGALGMMVTFLPTGQVDYVYRSSGNNFSAEHPTSRLYFLVRLRREPGSPAATDDFSGNWIAVNPFTGLVTVSDLGEGLKDNAVQNIAASRELAKTSLGKGGN